LEAQLKQEVDELLAKAEAADKADLPDGMSVPDELALREERLKKIAEGRKLYALRKQTREPVFGIIKSVTGFRQFSLCGLEAARGEWSRVTMSWNIKRMFVLAAA
ncbi:MAG TPA: transposase, partial [Methylocystis sp.]|nr:transposase [Methylocystis sp.]